jgi:hypothetical protein
MKNFLLFTLTLISLNSFADEACQRICNSDANQIGLMCQKQRQICMRIGNVDSINYELCMDNVSACLQNGSAIFESCIQNCQNEDAQ